VRISETWFRCSPAVSSVDRQGGPGEVIDHQMHEGTNQIQRLVMARALLSG
jgi:alkylation response protein AidB-like acyl-CoA dehydrogenase